MKKDLTTFNHAFSHYSKSLLSLALAILMTISTTFTVNAYEADQLYKMWAPNGYSTQIIGSEVEDYLTAGWRLNEDEVLITLYYNEGDGIWDEASFYIANIVEYLLNGWYLAPNTKTMWSLDGRCIGVPYDQVDAYQNVGWYINYEDVIQNLYREDKVITVYKANVDAYMQQGWYPFQPYTLYSLDGRSIVIPKEEIEAYLSVGWYFYNDAVQKLYSQDNQTITVFKAQVPEYLAVGWYDSPLTDLWALDGRTIRVPQNQVDAYCQVGWYRSQDDVKTKVYDTSGNSITIYKAALQDYLNNGWKTYEQYKEYKNREIMSMFSIGAYVKVLSFFATYHGTITNLDYEKGKVEVYIEKAQSNSTSGTSFNNAFGQMVLGVGKKAWFDASSVVILNSSSY